MTPRISVVIPTYNRPQLLIRAVDSALAQTAARDCEIVVVDDGSIEDPRPALVPYGTRVRLIQRTNGGLAAARNTGIAAGRGEFIALLDDDDEWLPKKLESQLAAMDRHRDAVLCTTLTENVAPDGSRSPRRTGFEMFDAPVECLPALLEWNFIPPSSVLLRRSLFNRAGAFAADLRQAEDYELWARLAARGPLICLSQPLTLYTAATPGSLSGNSLRQLQYEQLARRRMKSLAAAHPATRAAWRRGWLRCQTDLRDVAFRSGACGVALAAAVRAIACDPLGRSRWEWRRLLDSLTGVLRLTRPRHVPAPVPVDASRQSAP